MLCDKCKCDMFVKEVRGGKIILTCRNSLCANFMKDAAEGGETNE